MPFTLAHAAAVVPLARPLGRFGVLSALVVGSLVPDMAYFVGLQNMRTLTHSLGGMLWFCLPVGLVMYLLYHWLLKGPLLGLLPEHTLRKLAAQVRSVNRLPAASWPAVLLSLLLGATTHDVWDAFTHRSGWGTPLIPPLLQPALVLDGFVLYGYMLAQHASTALGLLLLLYWCRRGLRQAPAQPGAALPLTLPPAAKLAAVALLVLLPLGLGLWQGWQQYTDSLAACGPSGFRLRVFVGGTVFTALPTFTATLLAYGLAWQAWRLRRAR